MGKKVQFQCLIGIKTLLPLREIWRSLLFPFLSGEGVRRADLFPDKDYPGDYGTAMCPLKLGYRYTLNGTGQGLYVEPQAGFNLYGVTSLQDDYGHDVDLKYHGVVLAAGAGYLFSIGRTPFDVNLRYETVIAHGGSNNIVSLGLSRTISFGKRNSDY